MRQTATDTTADAATDHQGNRHARPDLVTGKEPPVRLALPGQVDQTGHHERLAVQQRLGQQRRRTDQGGEQGARFDPG